MSELRPEDSLEIGGIAIPAGRRVDLELKVARLATGTWVSLPVAVLRGRRPGPCLWLSAAIHGDELNGIEIVRRVMPRIEIGKLRGTVIAAPIVNVFGFLHQDRYLPDRRDLNRTFPGTPRGSLASRTAHLFMTEVVQHCSYGIDLHTGSHHRTNLPQIRANLADPETRHLSAAFRAPIAIHAKSRDGSLRHTATERGCRVLVYEAGETLRFDRPAIRLGVRGVLRVLNALRMLPSVRSRSRDEATRFVTETHWVRAPRGGILLLEVERGDAVRVKQTVARITDTFSEQEREIRAPFAGTVVGLTTNPVVNRGDAIVHLAAVEDSTRDVPGHDRP